MVNDQVVMRHGWALLGEGANVVQIKLALGAPALFALGDLGAKLLVEVVGARFELARSVGLGKVLQRLARRLQMFAKSAFEIHLYTFGVNGLTLNGGAHALRGLY